MVVLPFTSRPRPSVISPTCSVGAGYLANPRRLTRAKILGLRRYPGYCLRSDLKETGYRTMRICPLLAFRFYRVEPKDRLHPFPTTRRKRLRAPRLSGAIFLFAFLNLRTFGGSKKPWSGIVSLQVGKCVVLGLCAPGYAIQVMRSGDSNRLRADRRFPAGSNSDNYPQRRGLPWNA